MCGKYLLQVAVVCTDQLLSTAEFRNADTLGIASVFSLPAQRRVGFATRAGRMPAFTDLRARTNAGEDVSFDVFTGKVVLVVNVARL